MGILDQIIDTQQQKTLEQFEHALIVNKLLEPLKEREKNILIKRYGLNGHSVSTLKTVGEEQGLTRERVRQIEKELLQALKRNAKDEEVFVLARDLIVNMILEHGGIISEERLMELLNSETPEQENAIRFILHLVAELELVDSEEEVKPSWTMPSFNRDLLKNFIAEIKSVFHGHGKPMHAEHFLEKVKETQLFKENSNELNDKVLINFLHATAPIQQNVFGEYGLEHWSEIHPKDVGDKAYLVMRHHKKPEHYSSITELINKHKLDNRTAYKETVHNKLIKDKRFVLVGRGIYALAEWGYKPGVVSDMIKEILVETGKPMTRDEIVAEVLSRRMVKKNTILVGLSNKKMFQKVGKNLYALAE
jgi:hypothetical protein